MVSCFYRKSETLARPFCHKYSMQLNVMHFLINVFYATGVLYPEQSFDAGHVQNFSEPHVAPEVA